MQNSAKQSTFIDIKTAYMIKTRELYACLIKQLGVPNYFKQNDFSFEFFLNNVNKAFIRQSIFEKPTEEVVVVFGKCIEYCNKFPQAADVIRVINKYKESLRPAPGTPSTLDTLDRLNFKQEQAKV